MDSHPTDTIGMPMTGQSQERRVVRLAHGAVVVDHATLLDGIDFELAPQAVTGLVGPNGAGKSTLLKVLARQQALTSGACFVDGLAYASLGSREFSHRVGYLPQSIPSTPAMTVDELVCLGRFPWHGALGRFTDSDRAAVDEALAITATAQFANRFVDSLSGGERQRCWIAMLLAQEAGVLLLDEPVSALDARHQIETMEFIGRISRDRNVSILVVLHDVNLVARYCDRAAALKAGRIVWEGAADGLMDTRLLEELYGIPMMVLETPRSAGRLAFAAMAADRPQEPA